MREAVLGQLPLPGPFPLAHAPGLSGPAAGSLNGLPGGIKAAPAGPALPSAPRPGPARLPRPAAAVHAGHAAVALPLKRRAPRSLLHLRRRGRRGPGKAAGPRRRAKRSGRGRPRPSTCRPPHPYLSPAALSSAGGLGQAGPSPAAALPAPHRGSSLGRARWGGRQPGSAHPLAPPRGEHRPMAAARPRRPRPLPGLRSGGFALATAFRC